MKKKILVISIITMVVLSSLLFIKQEDKELKENKEISINTNNIISYTIDGEIAQEKPTKEQGYKANKIKCDKGSIISWDNDNWEVEIIESKGQDRCMVDFTKEESTPGYKVTITTNSASNLDSLSKTAVENGKVIIYSKATIASISGCSGEIKENKVIINNITQNQTCNITVEQKTLANAIKNAYPPKAGRTDFNNIDNGIPGLYTGTDDQGTTYYFSGDGSSMNNWVSFAGKKWRIIRINGNGSIRLLYAGNGTSATDIGTSAFNSTYNHPAYVGWKYTVGGSLATNRGNGTKSTIYSKVETWYNGLSSTDKNYIDTGAIYCNDRNIASGYSYSTSSTFYYAAYGRLGSGKTPTFNCSNTSDRFYTFGLMTADEVAFAGGVYGTNSPKAYYYLAQDGTSSITGSDYWWTMSPSYFASYALVFIVLGSGYPGRWVADNVYYSYVVRPVVSLKSSVLVTGGSGTGTNPYTLQMP